MRTYEILLMLALVILVPAYLEAQQAGREARATARDTTYAARLAKDSSTTPVTPAVQAQVLAAIDSTPRTIAALVAATKLPEPTVRLAALRLWSSREIRYRMVIVTGATPADTTLSGRPRRERAYYRPTSPPTASGRPSPRPR
jgi:hypothetical protein